MILSFRARDILQQLKYSQGKSESPSWIWGFKLRDQDESFIKSRFESLFYSLPRSSFEVKEVDILFLETLSRLCYGKSIDALNRLTFREIESYLRDENHQKAFGQEPEEPLIGYFEQVKKSLLASVLKEKCKKNDLLKSFEAKENEAWPLLSFVEKNRKVLQFLAAINALFPNEMRPELLLVDGEDLNVRMNGFPFSKEVLQEVINDHFLITEGKTSLKVVAAL